MWDNTLNVDSGRISLQKLPNDLLAHAGLLNLITTVNSAPRRSLGKASCRGPRINSALGPRRHWGGAHSAVFPDQIDNAPAVVLLLNVLKRQGRNFPTSEAATDQNREHRVVAQSLLGGGIRRIEENLRVVGGTASRLGRHPWTLHALLGCPACYPPNTAP